MTEFAVARHVSELLPYLLHSGRSYEARLTVPAHAAAPRPTSQYTPASAISARQLGESELSYYLPSRGNGVNDMYLHLGFRAPPHSVRRERVRIIWATLRARHPLLTSKVVMLDYDDVSFECNRRSPKDELVDAESNLEYRISTKDELINSYLNGPRTLSDNRLSYLILSQNVSSPSDFDFLLCTTHFIGDGMSLHQFANDFLHLLGSDMTDRELEVGLYLEWQKRMVKNSPALPAPLDSSFPTESRLRRAALDVDFKRNEEKQLGGHAFTRRSAHTRHTVTRVVSFDPDRTKAILQRCKSHGVSVSAALFAICNLAWIRMTPNKAELPALFYSALNMRPYVPPRDSYWFLAVGFFNVILPNFLPTSADEASVFWARARSAKEQSMRAAKSPLLISRTRRTATERAQRSRAWAKEDDDKERGIFVPPPSATGGQPNARAPSTALMGLSLLGNLDSTYKHATFSDIKLHTLTTGSRQRPGSLLLFGYTFAGKLWISLGYDENGLDKDMVEAFWQQCLRATDNFL
ncbi:hypothetical protein FIBSPDRAFT_820874 [Athelia psychrophila]|uniref:CoA-dependent acyltransferase n=1 Tax=Athelia psychrophila TaxID=1759441 RepID=A0A166NU69_9AGAM|nr:hypothetical protein FIBSPDRAFT_820874 [Fibularhizoctonia sp. CBS 109695]